ncbi:MAG: ParB N-terminal domain-containing protein [Oscillospiraceae bacterium]|nr:ParB N-terminal domain-containing protein [Oscillospiraceae bacterium]
MAEKKTGFNLAAALGAVPNLDTGKEQIEYIDIDRIKSDDKNFYELSALDALIENIELVGLMDPIRVRPDGDEYIIVSGHRRTAALRKLCESDDKWRSVPAIVEDGNSSPAMQELRLIYANSATREMSSVDKAKQVERVTELLYQLKEEGVEFPGRMRDHVAEACNISKSKLARLKVINDNLIPDMWERYNKGELTEQAAYTIARLPQNVQEDLQKLQPKKSILGGSAENILHNYEKYYEPTCECPDGTECKHKEKRIKVAASATNSWDYCDGGCCLKCNHSCSYRCSKSLAKKADDKAKEGKRAEAEAKKAAKKIESAQEQSSRNAAFLVSLADNAGLKDDAMIKTATYYGYEQHSVKDLRRYASGDKPIAIRPYDPTPRFSFSGNASPLIETAKLLKVSTDYLLGLTEDNAQTATTDEPTFRTGEPPKEGTYYCKFDCSGVILHQVAVWNSLCKWWAFKKGAKIDAECLGWYPLPEDKENA